MCYKLPFYKFPEWHFVIADHFRKLPEKVKCLLVPVQVEEYWSALGQEGLRGFGIRRTLISLLASKASCQVAWAVLRVAWLGSVGVCGSCRARAGSRWWLLSPHWCLLGWDVCRGCSGGNHSLEVFGKLGGRGKGGCSSFNNAGKVVAVETSSRSSKCQDQTAPTAAARLSPERLPRAGSLEAGWLFLETLGVSWPSAWCGE